MRPSGLRWPYDVAKSLIRQSIAGAFAAASANMPLMQQGAVHVVQVPITPMMPRLSSPMAGSEEKLAINTSTHKNAWMRLNRRMQHCSNEECIALCKGGPEEAWQHMVFSDTFKEKHP